MASPPSLLIAAVFLSSAGLLVFPAADGQEVAGLCRPAPSWTVGGVDLMSEARGNVTVVALLAASCPFCVRQTFLLGALKESLALEGVTANFLIVNEDTPRSRSLVWKLTSAARGVIPVYQELRASEPVWSVLGGAKDDFYIYDRCGRLAYHLPLPFSKLTSPAQYVKKSIISTFWTAVCGPCEDVSQQRRNELDDDDDDSDEQGIISQLGLKTTATDFTSSVPEPSETNSARGGEQQQQQGSQQGSSSDESALQEIKLDDDTPDLLPALEEVLVPMLPSMSQQDIRQTVQDPQEAFAEPGPESAETGDLILQMIDGDEPPVLNPNAVIDPFERIDIRIAPVEKEQKSALDAKEDTPFGFNTPLDAGDSIDLQVEENVIDSSEEQQQKQETKQNSPSLGVENATQQPASLTAVGPKPSPDLQVEEEEPNLENKSEDVEPAPFRRTGSSSKVGARKRFNLANTENSSSEEKETTESKLSAAWNPDRKVPRNNLPRSYRGRYVPEYRRRPAKLPGWWLRGPRDFDEDWSPEMMDLHHGMSNKFGRWGEHPRHRHRYHGRPPWLPPRRKSKWDDFDDLDTDKEDPVQDHWRRHRHRESNLFHGLLGTTQEPKAIEEVEPTPETAEADALSLSTSSQPSELKEGEAYQKADGGLSDIPVSLLLETSPTTTPTHSLLEKSPEIRKVSKSLTPIAAKKFLLKRYEDSLKLSKHHQPNTFEKDNWSPTSFDEGKQSFQGYGSTRDSTRTKKPYRTAEEKSNARFEAFNKFFEPYPKTKNGGEDNLLTAAAAGKL